MPPGPGTGGQDAMAHPEPQNASCEPTSNNARALLNLEYRLTIRDLLHVTDAPILNALLPDGRTRGIHTSMWSAVTPAKIQQFEQAADQLAMLAPVLELLSCDPAMTSEDNCAQQFITTFGLRVYRRPLSSVESRALLDAYTNARMTGDFTTGIVSVIASALKAPAFYQVETPNPSKRPALLDSYEVASRLSYFLYRSMPDEPLFAAVAAGGLTTRQEIEAQAHRMLTDPKAHDAVNAFFTEWLDLDHLDDLASAPNQSADVAARYAFM